MAAAAILNLFESKTAPLHPPSQKTHPIVSIVLTKHIVREFVTGGFKMRKKNFANFNNFLKCVKIRKMRNTALGYFGDENNDSA